MLEHLFRNDEVKGFRQYAGAHVVIGVADRFVTPDAKAPPKLARDFQRVELLQVESPQQLLTPFPHDDAAPVDVFSSRDRINNRLPILGEETPD